MTHFSLCSNIIPFHQHWTHFKIASSRLSLLNSLTMGRDLSPLLFLLSKEGVESRIYIIQNCKSVFPLLVTFSLFLYSLLRFSIKCKAAVLNVPSSPFSSSLPTLIPPSLPPFLPTYQSAYHVRMLR